MNKRPSASIRKNDNDIAKLEGMSKLCENLVAVEKNRLNGATGYRIGEVSSMMKTAVQEVFDGKRQ